jgi:hypothetical protein
LGAPSCGGDNGGTTGEPVEAGANDATMSPDVTMTAMDANVGVDAGIDSAAPPIDATTPVDANMPIDSGGCAVGLTMCNGACVQLRSDLNNCGACGAACTAATPSTAECIVGECVVLLATATPAAATDLAVDSAHVYWTDQVTNTIQRVPLGGGAVQPLVSSQLQAHRIALDATSIYWLTNGVGAGVWKSARDGTGVTQLVAAGNLNDLVVTPNGLYFIGGGAAVSFLPNGADASVPLAQNPMTGNPIMRLAVDDTSAYYTEYGTNIYRTPLDAGPTVTLTMSNGMPQSGLALTPTDVYWGTATYVESVPIAGGATQTRSNVALFGVTADSQFLYGFTPTGSIVKVPLAGGNPETLVFRNMTSAYTILDIAVDATSVYWTETNSNVANVFKVTPK